MKPQKSMDWTLTSKGEPRGYIDPRALHEIWFHTGTACNLQCPSCLEGSGPGDTRIELLTLADVRPFILEALALGVERFSFTGGEPFVNPDIVAMLAEALDHKPCLVLTNATEPLQRRFAEILPLRDQPQTLSFRVSLDHPEPALHDEKRGPGMFQLALENLQQLHQAGFNVSIARRLQSGEDSEAVDRAYAPHLAAADLPADIRIVKFPDLHPPGTRPQVPEISETCMIRYLSPQQRADFMCSFSRMVVKKNGRCGVYPCTLVDDVAGYELAATLREAAEQRVLLGHHRCYACFAFGASCSENK